MSRIAAARAFWESRSPRERRVLRMGAAAVAGVILYVVLIGPGMDARRKLSAALPKQRAQLEEMRHQEREIAALRKKIGASPRRADLKPLLQSSLARTSFANAVTRLDALQADRAVLVAAPVVFDDWVGWAEDLQRELGIRLEECRMSALDQPGLVRIEATFAAAGQAGTGASR